MSVLKNTLKKWLKDHKKFTGCEHGQEGFICEEVEAIKRLLEAIK